MCAVFEQLVICLHLKQGEMKGEQEFSRPAFPGIHHPAHNNQVYLQMILCSDSLPTSASINLISESTCGKTSVVVDLQ